MFFSCARGWNRRMVSLTKSNGLKGTGRMDNFPASIFEKSSMSFKIASRLRVDASMISPYSRCSLLRSVSKSISVMPMMAFIGVRIS